MTSKFRILISSDLDFEDLCAEIYYEDEFVGMLTQEQGFENLEIEIHQPKGHKIWSFKFAEFESILKSARATLWEMRKISD